jgi:hypothetical protein
MGARITHPNCYPEFHDTQLTVLEKILQCGGGGSGGGGAVVGCGCVVQGHGTPVAAPAIPTIPYVYTDLDSGILYAWNVDTQAWI